MNTDPTFVRDYTAGLNNFLINVGMDQYNEGVLKRKINTKSILPIESNLKLQAFDNNSKIENIEVIERPDGGYLKKSGDKWYEVKTPGEKVDVEGADGYDINYWRTQVYGLPKIEGVISTASQEELDNKEKKEQVVVDDLFGGLTEFGWSPSSNPNSIKEDNILFNYGDEDFVVKTLTDEYGQQEYGPNKTKFTFDSAGTIEDKVTVCFGKNNCKKFEFDNMDIGQKDAKEAQRLQTWMRNQVREATDQVDEAQALYDKYTTTK